MTAFPIWMYRNPELICDIIIAEKKKQELAEKKHFEITLKQNRRRIRGLVKIAKRGGIR